MSKLSKGRNLFCYCQPYDRGTAPNPYNGSLSLAICKPYIRKIIKPGDWLAGFNGSQYGKENIRKLIWMGECSSVISMSEFWFQYPEKRGRDNIWKPKIENPQKPDDFEFFGNVDHSHRFANLNDLKSQRVPLFDIFVYFGQNAPKIPEQILSNFKKFPFYKNKNGIWQGRPSRYGCENNFSDAKEVWNLVTEGEQNTKIQGTPYDPYLFNFVSTNSLMSVYSYLHRKKSSCV